jgi:hypothetical protein
VLCKLQGLELHKVSTASYAVKNRFDLLPQPVIIDTAFPQYDHVWRRKDKEEIDALCIILDHSAVDIITNSLGGGLVVGDEVRFSLVECRNTMLTTYLIDPPTTISCIRQIRYGAEIGATSASVSYRTVTIEVPCVFRNREQVD